MVGRHSLHPATEVREGGETDRPDVLHEDLVEFGRQSRGATLREHRTVAGVGLEIGLPAEVKTSQGQIGLTVSFVTPSRTVMDSLMSF
jgi:hypothetical protein